MRFELELKHRAHGMKAAELHGLSREQVALTKNFLLRNHSDDPFYKAKDGVSPFLQGCNDRDWVLIEFWCGDSEESVRKVESYLELLNSFVFGEV